MTIMTDPVITSCGHEFCRDIITKCENKCPICRAFIEFTLPSFETIELMKKIKYSVDGKIITYEQYCNTNNIIKTLEKYGLKIEKNIIYDKKPDYSYDSSDSEEKSSKKPSKKPNYTYDSSDSEEKPSKKSSKKPSKKPDYSSDSEEKSSKKPSKKPDYSYDSSDSDDV